MSSKIKLMKSFSSMSQEAGCDEVGRGCLCGPVVAAAVILKPNFRQNFVNDSKLITLSKRLEMADYIKNECLEYCIAEISPAQIDEENILNATFSAMHLALENLQNQPQFIIVDGNHFRPYKNVKHECIVKGDSKYLSIAAASILAKVYRDTLMINLHEEFPDYGWNTNMGYATKKHREALNKLGPTIHHRKSFRLNY